MYGEAIVMEIGDGLDCLSSNLSVFASESYTAAMAMAMTPSVHKKVLSKTIFNYNCSNVQRVSLLIKIIR
jgi:hypothetical protein